MRGYFAGLRFALPEEIEQYPGSWRREGQFLVAEGESAFWVEQLRARRPRIVWDIGANVGAFSLAAASYSDKVFAFEPVPQLAEMLRKCAAINALANIQAYEVALGDRMGAQSFYYAGDGESGRSRLAYPGNMTVNMWRADELCLEPPSLIKLDVEGSEEAVLVGAARMLQEYHPPILMEFWNETWANQQQTRRSSLLKLIWGLGYEFIEAVGPSDVWVCNYPDLTRPAAHTLTLVVED